ncbi:MAG: rRNA maturation RNase YbeY [Ferruginibacter sp.]
MQINFQFQQSIKLPGRTLLKKFINSLIINEKRVTQGVTFVFCSDSYLLNINQVFLNHNDLTDIITFNLGVGEAIVGEIYISTERIRENALKYNVSFNEELYRVMFHGLLHLCGYNDKLKGEKIIMRKKEDFYLRRYMATVSRGT